MIKTLEGIRVLDFTLAAAGPFCSRLLGACGAENILVEPLTGSHSRVLEIFDYVCSGKRSLPLDAKKPEAKEVLRRLILQSDVFVSNYRTGGLARLGLSYEDVSAINPRIIYATLTGFGEKGPDADNPGWDATAFFARGGIVGTYSDGKNAGLPTDMMGDICTGMALWGGICSALAYRERTGKGMRVHNSLLQTALFINNGPISHSQHGGKYPEMRESPYRTLRNVYSTKDGKAFIQSVPTIVNFNAILHYVGRDDVIESGKFRVLADTMNEGAVEGVKLLDEIYSKMTLEEVMEMFRILDLSAEPVATPGETLNDPQVAPNDYMYECWNTIADQPVIMPTVPPVKFGDDTSIDPFVRGPRLGEQSIEILRELKFTEEEIAELLAKKVTVDGSKKDLYVRK